MSTKSDKTSALVPRPSSAVEKAEPGAKRVLALMVCDTLAIAHKQFIPVSTATTQAELENWFQQGLKYYFGRGVPQNYTEATKWFRIASEQGYLKATEMVFSIESWLSPEQIAEGDRRYNEFKLNLKQK